MAVESPVELIPPLPAHMRGLNVRDFLEQAVADAADEPFLITREETLSFGAFDAAVNRAARRWQDLGVGKGDRVAVMLENSPGFLIVWFGLAKRGAILVGLNTRWKSAEVADAIARTRPSYVVADGHHRETVMGAGVEHPLELSAFLAESESSDEDFQRPPLSALDPISFIFTSGTTGHPKAVQQTHGAYVLTGQAYPWWLGLERGDRIYACLPLLHINAQAYSTMGAIAIRGGLILVERFSASRFWDDIRTHRANAFNFIGAIIAILLKAEPGPHERDHALRVMYGAPSFPGPERKRIEERFGGVAIISGFGMSETTFGLIESPTDERPTATMGRARQHPDSAFHNEVRVVDEQGEDAAVGVPGELLIRNPALMRGYFEDPERTAESLRDGWLWTGDLAVLDADGRYAYVDRKKDLVRRRGENVSSVEVEVVLRAHPAVEEAAVVGVASELTDEEVLAYIEPRAGQHPDPRELTDWCAERLADFKVPRYILLVDTLPRTSTGKLQKGELRERFAAAGEPWDRDA
jgi:crotonobetaine/carnitine-CoA ligase